MPINVVLFENKRVFFRCNQVDLRLLWWALIQYDLHFEIKERYQAETKHIKTTLYDSRSQNWSNVVTKLRATGAS